MNSVEIRDPSRMNLLGLMLADILRRSPETAPLKNARVVIRGGPMAITLEFVDGRCTISRGPSDAAHAELRAGLDTLVQISLRGGLVGAFLSGRLKVRGNPFVLLRLRRLLRV